jgi:hypothetical protein
MLGQRTVSFEKLDAVLRTPSASGVINGLTGCVLSYSYRMCTLTTKGRRNGRKLSVFSEGGQAAFVGISRIESLNWTTRN